VVTLITRALRKLRSLEDHQRPEKNRTHEAL